MLSGKQKVVAITKVIVNVYSILDIEFCFLVLACAVLSGRHNFNLFNGYAYALVVTLNMVDWGCLPVLSFYFCFTNDLLQSLWQFV